MSGSSEGERCVAAKHVFRVRSRHAVALLSASRRRSYDEAICQALLGSEAYRLSRQVLAYVALADEVSLRPLLERAEGAGKSVYLPVTDASTWQLSFRSWNVGQPLVDGVAGTRTPEGGTGPGEAPSLVIVPGRAFDGRGGRVGRGRGCYDRCMPFLEGLGVVVGVAYEAQLSPIVPVDRGDRSVEALVTESGIRAFSERARASLLPGSGLMRL